MNETYAAEYAAVWSVLVSVLGVEPPSQAVVDTLRGSETFARWPLEHGPYGGQERVLWSALRSSPESYGDIVDDHFGLFVGPGKPVAPPWESVHRNSNRLMFQQETMDVREQYRKHGLEIQNIHQEPDDHIAFELEFCSSLLQRALSETSGGGDDRAEKLLRAHDEFVDAHLAQWAPEFFRIVEESSDTAFYRSIGALGGHAVTNLAEIR